LTQRLDPNIFGAMNKTSVGYKEALNLLFESIKPVPAEQVSLIHAIGCIVASDLISHVDSPTQDASLKDGYAVLSGEVANALPEAPVRLRLSGYLAAGDEKTIKLTPGTTVQVLTGARIPEGADAVVAEEFTTPEGTDIIVKAHAEPGRNILPHGNDVAIGKIVVKSGRLITPGLAGLLAAAGHSAIPVHKKPQVGIISTGDEIVAPGNPLPKGKLYASNMVTLAAWCVKYGMKTQMSIAMDNHKSLLDTLKTMVEDTDAVITSGGAWTGDRDLVAHVLENMGWEQKFHRIRIGPGKAVGFGILAGKPVFILPGGPTSNLMGFFQIALPGLLAMSGHSNPGLPATNARLASNLLGRESDWTHFFFGVLQETDGLPVFHPVKHKSRLQSIADATAIASIQEGQMQIAAGSVIPVQLLI
jgi:molybdopterin molybdotransferase